MKGVSAGFPVLELGGLSGLNLDVNFLIVCLLPVWVLGALTGMLLPRPRFSSSWGDGTTRSALLFSLPPGSFLRRLALLYHGFILLRELWASFTSPGTFHAFMNAVWARMRGEKFVLPPQLQRTLSARGNIAAVDSPKVVASPQQSSSEWYVTDADLEFFKKIVEEDAPVAGAGDWQKMCDKDFDHLQYTAWKRHLAGNRTEYKSVTVAEDATAEEFMDFYLDDTVRPSWDGMISHYDVLENGSGVDRQQVVRWERTFPFSFINKREYIIGRRMWRQDGCLYGMTKAIEHPRAIQEGSTVRMDVFYSMWRSRTIPCPRGSDRPACETVLLHLEQFKIPENLARFAVRHGMATFVKKMGPAVQKFVAERRSRVGPFQVDPNAYGVNTVPNPPSTSEGLPVRSLSEEACFEKAPTSPATPRSRGRLLRLGTVAVSLSAALLASGRSRRCQ